VPQIAVKISDGVYAKLKRLAHQGQTNYATIVEAALSAYEPVASEASDSSEEIKTLIDAALQPVLERLATLEKMGIVKHQHLSGVTAQISLHNAPEIAVAASGIPEARSAEKGAEIGLESAVEALPGRVEKEASTSPSILPDSGPAKRSVKDFIGGLVAAGERSPTQIARALNEAGYRTGAGSEFQRGNPQIASALKGV
jgi:hypothetical protein